MDFELIFVTAYDNYAANTFEISAIDYLLKPIGIDKLKSAVERLKTRLKHTRVYNNYEALIDNFQDENFKETRNSQCGEHKIINIADIIAIEAQESYSLIPESNTNPFLLRI